MSTDDNLDKILESLQNGVKVIGKFQTELIVERKEAKASINKEALRIALEIIGEDVTTNPNPEIPEGSNKTYDIQCYYRLGANELRNKLRKAFEDRYGDKK